MVKKALVVDNNEVILKILSHILQTRGLQVETAVDGLSAIQLLQNYHPDIIFTDLIMPNIDGENLCRILSRQKKFRSTLLVIVSAIAVEDKLDFLSFGAHICIAKGPASTMAESIDSILSHANEGRIDILKGKRLGIENLVPRTIAKELLGAKHHLKLILDNIDNGILEFAESGAIVSCNAYVADLLNTNELEILSSNIRNLFSGKANQHLCECLDRFFSTQVPQESTRSLTVEGRDVVFKFVNMQDENYRSSIMIIRDITREKKARRLLEEHLGQLEKLVDERTKSYQAINRELQKKIRERKRINEELEFVARQWSNTFDTISDFVSVHDKNMKFVRVNKALANYLGKDPEELLGNYCYEIMHGRNTPVENCPHIASIELGKPVTFEINDSHIGVPLLVSCSPLHHDDGTLLGSVHIARDITDQKKASEIREKLITQLEESLAKVKLLSGFIPICSSCKNVRDDKGYWKQVEDYIRDKSEAEFSHSICPDCINKLYPGIMDD